MIPKNLVMPRFPTRFLIPLLSVISCSLVFTPCIAGEVDFNRDVRPILSDKCYKCHGPDASNQESEFRIDSHDNAIKDLGGYAGIVPGDLSASEVHVRIHDANAPMPPMENLKQLSDREKAILDEWIREGGQFESHWAFVPLPETVPIPKTESDWPAAPIDQFVLRGMQEAGIGPAPEMPREKWLRRVTFDLTGLPPTLEQIHQFKADDSGDAYEKVVDRLLITDECAERLTSEWLDVARYSDTYGYQRDDGRFVWPYRDWVINAFKNNVPFDEFVTWQLAGDLLPNATQNQRLATVFNRLHSHKKEGGVDIEEFRVENVSDRAHTVSAAMMGLTMECCRCHDHKYDPITTKEYYGFSAFFDNVDENGLISYFTDAVPTPAMPLANEQQQRQLDELTAKVDSKLADYHQYLSGPARGAYKNWLSQWRTRDLIPGRVTALQFDRFDRRELAAKTEGDPAKEDTKNHTVPAEVGPDAFTPKTNQLVNGRFGQAIELTGDEAVDIPEVGHFARHDPYSFSLWIRTPEVDERAVIYRRSRGWDDAGSIGYELTLDEGRLSAKMCHFWPGDAIAIQTEERIEADRWYHVGVTYDGSSRAAGLKLFLDGQLAEIELVEDHLTRQIINWRGGYEDLAIGSRYRDRGFVGGLVDRFEVFDRELSALEIEHLFDGRALIKSLAAGLDARLFDYYVAAIDTEAKQRRDELRAARKERDKLVDSIPAITIMREDPTPRQTYVLERGVYDQRGEPVEPHTPEFLPPMKEELPKNRLGLAQWLVSPDHPLTARVAVNRYWQLMFGTGLVRTPEDFGNQGELPTHEELLNWLARDFVQSGWDVRNCLRQIALSATYRQSSVADEAKRSLDPENRLFARGTGVRLSAEMIRDNALAVGGLLVKKVGGAPVKPYDIALAYNPLKIDTGEGLYRRSLYTYWKRTSPSPVMMTLNTPTREVCRLRREVTDTPLQALVMLNGPQFVEAARFAAARWLEENNDPKQWIPKSFLRLTSRDADAEEIEVLTEMFDEQVVFFEADSEATESYLKVGNAKTDYKGSQAELAAAAVVINALMNLDESVRHY